LAGKAPVVDSVRITPVGSIIFHDYIHLGERAGGIMEKLAEEFIRS
jgi:hypothetical protein